MPRGASLRAINETYLFQSSLSKKNINVNNMVDKQKKFEKQTHPHYYCKGTNVIR